MLSCVTQSFVELKLDDEADEVTGKYENMYFKDYA